MALHLVIVTLMPNHFGQSVNALRLVECCQVVESPRNITIELIKQRKTRMQRENKQQRQGQHHEPKVEPRHQMKSDATDQWLCKAELSTKIDTHPLVRYELRAYQNLYLFFAAGGKYVRLLH